MQSILSQCNGILSQCNGILTQCNGILSQCNGILTQCNGILSQCNGIAGQESCVYTVVFPKREASAKGQNRSTDARLPSVS
ncbi:hypothetical protein [Nostoc sp.]|uniref:hypothetical protein n=1 Tax=Nostoc sp. TaxID=1180 RepID=UPI002FF9FAEA